MVEIGLIEIGLEAEVSSVGVGRQEDPGSEGDLSSRDVPFGSLEEVISTKNILATSDHYFDPLRRG